VGARAPPSHTPHHRWSAARQGHEWTLRGGKGRGPPPGADPGARDQRFNGHRMNEMGMPSPPARNGKGFCPPASSSPGASRPARPAAWWANVLAGWQKGLAHINAHAAFGEQFRHDRAARVSTCQRAPECATLSGEESGPQTSGSVACTSPPRCHRQLKIRMRSSPALCGGQGPGFNAVNPPTPERPIADRLQRLRAQPRVSSAWAGFRAIEQRKIFAQSLVFAEGGRPRTASPIPYI